jgi:cell division septum initiation protein DivIVA
VEKIDGIINKINLILEHNLKLEETVNELKQKLKASEKERKSLEKDNDGYRKEIQLMKMAKSVQISEEERTYMKKELRKYIKEIDKCMALLNK